MLLNNPLKTPAVIIHRGMQPYLKYNLEITSKTNEIILVGSEDLAFLARDNKNVHFVDIANYENKESIVNLKEYFKNYSTNDFEFEWRCFERVFILQDFIKEYELDSVFHLDSDAVLLVDINNLIFEKNCGYLTPAFQDNFRMESSIHFGLIDLNFCNEFIKLFNEIYKKGDKFYLIKEKIDYHNKKSLKGGICDMTLYYLLKKEKYLNPQNFMKEVKHINSDEYVFLNNINLSEGYYSKKNFIMRNSYVKISNNSVYDTIQKKDIKLAGIHFQGTGKKRLNKFLKYKLRT